MKGIFFSTVFVLSLIFINGCYTVPRHYSYQEVIIYYPLPDDPPPSYYPRPPMPPQRPPVYRPPVPEPPNQPKDRQPEKPQNSYDQRDPLQGGPNRGSGEIKTDPPVRNLQQKDRGHQ